MSSAVDANVLLYASDSSSPRHERAVFAQPLAPDVARANLDGLLSRPHVRCPGEQAGFWSVFTDTAADDVIRGNLVPDAHLVALMRQHGVREMWTADRDFLRFKGIVVRDPFA